MRRFALCSLVVLLSTSALYAQSITIADVKRDAPVSFEHEVLPILRQSCLACHSESEKQGELTLETPKQMLIGGDSGPAVVAGKGLDSLLLKLAAHQEESFMPPPDNDVNAPQLTSEQLGVIRLWIDQGAKGDAAPTTAPTLKWESLPGALNPIYALVVSPDGQQVAVTRANQLFVYDIATGKMIAQLKDTSLNPAAAHQDLVKALAWSRDGRLLASGGFREVKLWEKPREARLSTLTTSAATTAIAVSSDRKQLAIAAANNEIQLYNADNAQAAAKLTGHTARVTAVEFTADGKRVVSASQDGTIRVWNSGDGAAIMTLTSPAPVDAMTLLPAAKPEEQQLVAGGADKTLRVWTIPAEAPTAEKPAEPTHTIPAHDNAITSLVAVPGQPSQVYSGSLDGTVRRWDLATQKGTATLTHGAPVLAIDVRADGKRIASVIDNGTAKLWDDAGKQIAEMKGDVAKQAEVARLTADHKATEQRVVLLKNRLATAEEALKGRTEAQKETETALAAAKEETAKQKTAAEEAAKMPPADAPAEKKDAKADKEEKADPAQLLADAEAAEKLAMQKQTSATTAVNNAQKFVDEVKQSVAAAEQRVAAAKASVDAATKADAESQKPLRSVRFSPNGQVVATSGDYQSVETWNAETGAAINAFDQQAAPCYPLAFLADDRVVSALGEKEAVIWNLNPSWRLLRTIGSAEQPELISDRATSLDFNSAGTQLLVGGGAPSRSGELSIFNVADGKRLHHWPTAHTDTVYSVQFSPDGTEFVSAGSDKYAKLWDINQTEAIRRFEGHGDYVLGAAWKGDATAVATISADHTLKIWDAESSDLQRTVQGFGGDNTAVTYVGETDQVLSSCGDGTVRLQNAANGSTVRNFAAGIWLHCVATTPDGKLIAAGSDDGRLFLWDGTNAKQLHVIKVGE